MKKLLILLTVCIVLPLAAQDHSYPGLDVVAGAASEMTKEQLCDASFRTGSIRPTAADTNKVKRALFDQMTTQGQVPPNVTIADYELDHVIALTNGGFTGLVYTAGKVDVDASIKAGNLRMQPRVTYFEKERERPESPWYQLDQPYPAAEMKDAIEVRMHKMLCTDQVTLKQAQILSGEQWQWAYGCLFMQVQQACEVLDRVKMQ